jgi:hypothetical protein
MNTVLNCPNGLQNTPNKSLQVDPPVKRAVWRFSSATLILRVIPPLEGGQLSFGVLSLNVFGAGCHE